MLHKPRFRKQMRCSADAGWPEHAQGDLELYWKDELLQPQGF